MTKLYSNWTHEQLVSYVEELEEVLYPAEAEKVIRQLTCKKLGPVSSKILSLLYAQSPSFVQTSLLVRSTGAAGGKSVKSTIKKLRWSLKPHGISIDCIYMRGYRLSPENALKLKELSFGPERQMELGDHCSSNTGNNFPHPLARS